MVPVTERDGCAAGLMNPVNFDSGMIHLYRLLGQIQ
jgi:hypothetical protein